MLELPRDSIKKIYINNVELAPEYAEQKFSRLNLKMNVDGRIVNIEIQLNPEANFKERTLFHWSKMYSDELGAGESYDALNQTMIPEVQDTIVMIRHLSADEKVREEARYREKRLHDEANALGGAKKEGIAEGRLAERNALIELWKRKGFTDDQINDLLSE